MKIAHAIKEIEALILFHVLKLAVVGKIAEENLLHGFKRIDPEIAASIVAEFVNERGRPLTLDDLMGTQLLLVIFENASQIDARMSSPEVAEKTRDLNYIVSLANYISLKKSTH